MNANIMKTQLFHKIIYDLKCNFCVMGEFCDFLTLRPSDLIETLTNVLIYGQLLSLVSIKLKPN